MSNKVKILVVDDRPENLYSMEEVLEGEPIELIKALSGVDALKACLEHEFAMAILDVQMPGMNGYELAKLIRGKKKLQHLPIIFVSAVFNSHEHAFKGYESGAVDFLTKPFEPTFLIAKVRIFTQLYLQTQALERELSYRCQMEKEKSIRNIQLSNAQRIVSMGSWNWDLEQGRVHWSDELRLLLGWETAPAGQIESLVDLVPKGDQAVFLEAVNQTKQAGDCFHLDHRILRADGQVLEVQATGEAMVEDGQVTQIIGTLLDVTHRKQIERQLTEAKEDAERLLAIKSEFIGMMSHEIRTPMSGLMGMVQLLEYSELDADQREYLRIIQQTSTNLMTLLTDLLDFSKIEAGQMKLDVTQFSLYDLIQKSIHLFFLPAQPKGLKLDSIIASDLPDLVVGDSTHLGQVITNLVGNGIKFTETGSVCLKATCKRFSESEILLNIAVTDTGVGVSEDRQEQIFESFCQVDSSLSRKYGGVGLGLAICKKLITLMGGSISVKSRLGQGSTFEIEVPLKTGTDPEIKTGGYHTLSGRRLLLADANPDLVERFRKNADRWSIQLQHAGDRASLEQLLRQDHEFDWIILDYNLPGASGLDVTAEIRNRAPQIPLILMTNQHHLNLIDRTKKMGIAHCVGKPLLCMDTVYSLLVKSALVSPDD